jgi:hypothetical protein
MIERFVDRRGWRHNLRSIVLDDEGLQLNHRRGPATRLERDELTEFRWLKGGAAELLTTRGTFRLEPSVERLDELARHLAAIEDARRAPHEVARDEEVRRWLGNFKEAVFPLGGQQAWRNWGTMALTRLLNSRALNVLLVLGGLIVLGACIAYKQAFPPQEVSYLPTSARTEDLGWRRC